MYTSVFLRNVLFTIILLKIIWALPEPDLKIGNIRNDDVVTDYGCTPIIYKGKSGANFCSACAGQIGCGACASVEKTFDPDKNENSYLIDCTSGLTCKPKPVLNVQLNDGTYISLLDVHAASEREIDIASAKIAIAVLTCCEV